MSEKLYWPHGRNYKGCGEYFTKHLEAMTVEGLHSKADIAWELAHLDFQRDALAATVSEQAALIESLQNRWASRPLSVEDTAALEKENDRLAARVAELERRMREAYKLAPAAFYPGDRQRVLDLLRPDSPDADRTS